MVIRAYAAADWPGVWAILEPVFRAGETYAFPRDMSESQAHDTWTAAGKQVFVAVDEATGELVGTYYVKPNFEGAASHICNCGYVVSESARGRGIAARMCEHYGCDVSEVRAQMYQGAGLTPPQGAAPPARTK